MFKLKVNTKRLEDRLAGYQAKLKTTLMWDLDEVAAELVLEVAERTPSPETEYEYLMTGGTTSGGVSKLVPLSGDRSADSDTVMSGAERIRFIRSPGRWLKELVTDPTTWRVDPSSLTIQLGIVPVLEAESRFSWQNRDRSGNEYQYTSDYGVWSFFEYGGPHEVAPRGTGYPLRPDDMTHHLDMPYSMVKNYPRFGMYTDFNKSTFVEAIRARIRDVKF